MKTIKKTSTTYAKSLKIFKAQFKDVTEITKLYLNKDRKVFAGEWLDSKGVINFNSGYAPDVDSVIIVK